MHHANFVIIATISEQ